MRLNTLQCPKNAWAKRTLEREWPSSLIFLFYLIFWIAIVETSFKQTLKAKAHHLKPVILLGSKGLTAAVIDETNLALLTHELIKVKINGAEKIEREQIAYDLCQSLHAELIQLIGSVAIIYRKNEADSVK